MVRPCLFVIALLLINASPDGVLNLAAAQELSAAELQEINAQLTTELQTLKQENAELSATLVSSHQSYNELIGKTAEIFERLPALSEAAAAASRRHEQCVVGELEKVFRQEEPVFRSADEVRVHVKAGEPTIVRFPLAVKGGFKPKNSKLAIEREDDLVVIFATPELPATGEALLVILADVSAVPLRIFPVTDPKERDVQLNLSGR